MTKGQFSPDEWRSLLNAPHWVYAALIAADRGSISTRRTEAKALEEFLSGYKTQSPLVKEIIAGQAEADDKFGGTLKDAERMLGEVGALLERKVSEDEGDAVRDLLMQAGEEVAKAAREALFGDATSGTEEKTLARIQTALKATEADKRRRHEAAAAAEAERRAREAAGRAETERRREEAARAEAQKKEAEAEVKRRAKEAEAKRRAAEAEAGRRAAESKRRAEEAEAQRKAEAEARKRAEEAEAQKKAAEAEAQQQAAEAAAAPAETGRIYVVKRGDTLSGIALQMYGKAGRWPEIYEANRDIIKKPNLIRPGWKLRIPD